MLQDFSPSRGSALPMVFLGTMVPAALRSLGAFTWSIVRGLKAQPE